VTERLDGLRAAGRVVAETIDAMEAAVRPGVTTAELDELAAEVLARHGARSAPMLDYDFPGTTCISINDEAVHGIPGKRRIRDGDLVSLDLGLILDGFWADMGCTVLVGKVSPEARRLVEVTDHCLDLAIEAAQPGNHLGDISAAVQEHAEGNGFAVIKQFVGHGIGRNMHEDPQVPNFGTVGTGPELKPGMTLAIEPMINQGTEEVYIKPDGWTVCTADGALSSYVEHTVAITRDGPRVLTRVGSRQPTGNGR
jgi:methionyl aminopeptidase